MPKANLVLPDGTTVQIEGNAADVAAILSNFSVRAAPETIQPGGRKRTKSRLAARGTAKRPKTAGPRSLITELAREGFFKTKRKLPDIQKKLEEQGHIYAQTSLSPAVLGLTKNKVLRRIKEKEGWAYVRGAADLLPDHAS